MTHPFGQPVALYTNDGDDGAATSKPPEDMELVRRTLASFNDGAAGLLRLYRPQPTAAFAPRDTTSPHYAAAAAAMQARGFAAVERRAGGHLAIYDGAALVIDWVAPHDDPRVHVHERYRQFSGAVAKALAAYAIDARVGALDSEYCPGDYSINGAGRIKLVGVAQRIVRCGFHVGAVISVKPSAAALAAVEEAYRILGIPFAPRTFGALADLAPGVGFKAVRTSVAAALTGLMAHHTS